MNPPSRVVWTRAAMLSVIASGTLVASVAYLRHFDESERVTGWAWLIGTCLASCVVAVFLRLKYGQAAAPTGRGQFSGRMSLLMAAGIGMTTVLANVLSARGGLLFVVSDGSFVTVLGASYLTYPLPPPEVDGP